MVKPLGWERFLDWFKDAQNQKAIDNYNSNRPRREAARKAAAEKPPNN